MQGLKWYVAVAILLSFASILLVPTPAFAYAGPGPGMEMIPYFFSLLALAGSMLGAAVLWPLVAFLRRIRSSLRLTFAKRARSSR